jgi:hypothetical protein
LIPFIHYFLRENLTPEILIPELLKLI